MSDSDPVPLAGYPIERLPERLGRLSVRLPTIDHRRPEGLMEVRDDLEALQGDSRMVGREEIAQSLKRLALLTEVWECLAAEERPESAAAVATFCARALEHLRVAVGKSTGAEDTSWILEESSACWSDYLGLIDSSTLSAVDSGPDPSPGFDSDLDADAGVDGDSGASAAAMVPQIDARTLFRMLTGTTLPTAELGGETLPSRGLSLVATREGEAAVGSSTFRAAGPVAVEIDADCREAFLAESADLFERIEALVLGLLADTGQTPMLSELSRCFHTLKGAAGSVGLFDLASGIHHLEQRLEEADGQVTPELLDRLHEGVGHVEAALDEARRVSGPGAVTTSALPGAESPEWLEPRGSTLGSPVEQGPRGDAEPIVESERADGPIRIPAGRMDELMDLASDLILRRGVWAAQAERLKEFAGMSRACRNALQARLDQLDELGLGRPERGAGGDRIATVLLRLAEQVEDLVVLTEAAQEQALPLADDSETLARLSLQLWETLQAIRIVPIRGLFQRLARVAHDAARIEGRDVKVAMIGEETGLDRAVQDKAFEPLLHVVRNAIGHGIEPAVDRTNAGKDPVGRVTLEARREGNTLVLAVEDDGRGLDYEAIAQKASRLGLIAPAAPASTEELGALIFRPGFSTRDEANAIAGRGVGMDVVAQEVRRLRGTIDLASQPGNGTRLTIRLAARLALEQATVALAGGQALAIPVSLIERAQPFEAGDVDGTGHGAAVRIRDRRVPLIDVREALGFSATAPPSCPKLLLVRAEHEELALLFDAIEGTRELVIKPLGPLLAGHPVIWGTSLSLTGDVIFVLNPSGLHHWLCNGRAAAVPSEEPAPRPAPVLVVDDSISVRRVVSRQLRMLGFDVDEVSNGVEALSKLSSRVYSMVLTDLEMPRMDGLELLAELRRAPSFASLPVILASTESRPATRRRAMALGASAFLAKPINQDELAQVASSLLHRAIGCLVEAPWKAH
jgi:chemotaxis protein histidine kinase CheA/CheY-like chemotaxis protein